MVVDGKELAGNIYLTPEQYCRYNDVFTLFPEKLYQLAKDYCLEQHIEIRRSTDGKKQPLFTKKILDRVFELANENGDIDVPELGTRHLVEIPLFTYSGIYFLKFKDEIVYIGQSINISARIGYHLRNKAWKIDSAYCLACDIEELDTLERYYILLYKPRYNQVYIN